VQAFESFPDQKSKMCKLQQMCKPLLKCRRPATNQKLSKTGFFKTEQHDVGRTAIKINTTINTTGPVTDVVRVQSLAISHKYHFDVTAQFLVYYNRI